MCAAEPDLCAPLSPLPERRALGGEILNDCQRTALEGLIGNVEDFLVAKIGEAGIQPADRFVSA